jgi:hypothetical protein
MDKRAVAVKVLETVKAARVMFADQPETLRKLDEVERDAMEMLK